MYNPYICPMFFLYKNKLTIVIFLLITALAGYMATNITFFHDLGRYLPEDRTDMQFLNEFKEKLEPDDNYLMIAVRSNNGVFNQPFLEKLDRFTIACDTISNIRRSLSITNMTRPLKLPFGNTMTALKVIDIKKPERYKKDSLRLMQDDRMPGRFISENGSIAGIVLKKEKDLNQKEAKQLIGTLNQLIAVHQFDEAHIAGKSAVQTAFSDLVQKEMGFYVFLCLSFLLIALIILFRRPITVIVAYISVLLGAVVFAGFIGFLELPLDLMAMLFPALMLIVGMSDVVHFLTKYSDELKAGVKRMDAMKTTIREIGWATLLTSGTTAAGFGSLYFSKIAPIREFGLTAACGVFIAYLTVLFFTTSLLIMFDPKKIVVNNRLDKFWDNWTRLNYWFVHKNKRPIVIGSLLVLALSLIGVYNISTNSYILSDVPQNSQLRQDFKFFEDHMAGFKVLEMAVMPQGGRDLTDPDVLKQVDKLETYLDKNTVVNALTSPITAYKMLNRASNGDKAKFYKLPGNPKRIDKYTKQLKRFRSKELNVLVSKDKKLGRISGIMPDTGSDLTKAMNAQVATWIDGNIDASLVQFRKTGTHYILDKNNEYLRESLTKSLALAILVVCLMMAFVFRDIKMVFIALVPNLLPLLIAGAIIGLIGMELKASTSIIFTIAFGIAVDHSIHFISKFQIERAKGYSIRGSIYHTFVETGKALYITTLILFFGFSLLIFSSFNGIFYVGLLVSITLVAALAACLLITPVVIEYLLKDKPTR